MLFRSNDSDPNGNTLGNPTIIDSPNHGSASVNGNGTIVYTPNNSYFGNDTLTYLVCENGAPNLCDTALVIISIPPSTPTATSNTPVCVGNTINLFTPSLSNAIYNWTGPNGFSSPSQNPSIVNATLAMAGTYSLTITSTQNGFTSGITTTTVVVNPQQSAAFSYSSGTFCQSGINPTPTITGTFGGTFTSVPVGLTINASTGTITAATSLIGTYSVTYITNGPCADTLTENVSISSTYNASFTYSSNTYCQNANQNPMPTFTGSAGVFTSIPTGLNFVNITSGEIDLANTASGTYIVYNTIAASGGCVMEIDSEIGRAHV